MNSALVSVYPASRGSITLVFDCGDPRQRESLRTFKDSFLESYSDTEVLYPPHYMLLHIYPGGALGELR